MKSKNFIYVLTVWFAVVVPPVQASEPVLKPYKAVYDARRSVMQAEMTITLRKDADGSAYLYQSVGNPTGFIGALVSRNPAESTRFEITEDGIRPLRFEINDGTRKGDHNVSIEFDWADGVIRRTLAGATTEESLSPQAQTVDTAGLSMRMALQAGRQPEPYLVVEDDQTREFRFSRLGEEQVSTAIGDFTAVKYQLDRGESKRVFYHWLVEDLAWLPVRIEQHKDGKPLYIMEILSFEWQ